MSLVERVAKHLEELARSGGRAVERPPDTTDDDSLISRALALEGAVPAAPKPPGALRFKRALKDRLEIDFSRLTAAGLLQPSDSQSQRANELRRIKRPLIQACQGKLSAPVDNAARIMVTSSLTGEGKTSVALNLALSLAMERDSTVLLIDADTTQPTLSRTLGMDSRLGLLDLLADRKTRISDALMPTSIDRLTFLSSGAPREHATELLASEAMVRLVSNLAAECADRILIFDSPPLLGTPEPAVLAGHMGQIVVVVEAERTTHKALTDALATIRSCPRIALVLNKAPKLMLEHAHYR
jgi:protein-tyrosine kinase